MAGTGEVVQIDSPADLPDEGTIAEIREPWMHVQDPVLIEQCQFAVTLQQPLDYEHHVRPPCIVLIENKCHRPLDGPGDDSLLELSDLLAVLKDNSVAPHQIQSADMPVQVDTYARPVQPGAHLLNVCGLTRSVESLKQHSPVPGKGRQDGQRYIVVEPVGRVSLRDMVIGLTEGGYLEIRVDVEQVPDRNHMIRHQSCQLLHSSPSISLADPSVASPPSVLPV